MFVIKLIVFGDENKKPIKKLKINKSNNISFGLRKYFKGYYTYYP